MYRESWGNHCCLVHPKVELPYNASVGGKNSCHHLHHRVNGGFLYAWVISKLLGLWCVNNCRPHTMGDVGCAWFGRNPLGGRIVASFTTIV